MELHIRNRGPILFDKSPQYLSSKGIGFNFRI